MKPRKEPQRDKKLTQDSFVQNFSSPLHITIKIIMKCSEVLDFQKKFECSKEAKITDLFPFFSLYSLYVSK